MSNIGKNIKWLRDKKGLSQEALAEKLKLTRARIGSYEEERNAPPTEVLIAYSDFFHISIDALIRGDFSKTNPFDLMSIAGRRLFPISVDNDGNNNIEVVPISARAGYLNGYADPEYISGLQTITLPFRMVGKHRTFPIAGDSMPPLKEGSFVVGKFIESINDIHNGNTYVLITKDDGIVYKRVYKLENEGNGKTLALHSDNKKYDPYSVKAEDVVEIWEYVCSISRGQYSAQEITNENIIEIVRSLQIEVEKLKNKGGS
ncbi:MAG: LexA family transcriptional regulator [Bacteroidia bacterium]|jgi:transcriptional regulator with XRE-family HTH domain|nr:LexA family transcriptional regulator [Bacteroidia bacterium]